MLFYLLAPIMGLTAGPPRFADELWRDSRVVRNVAEFNLGEIVAGGDAVWAIVEVFPGRFSGAEKLVGTSINGQTGKVVRTPGAYSVFMLTGSYNVTNVLNGKTDLGQHDYHWEIPSGGGGTGTRPKGDQGKYVPLFMHGGVAICRMEEDQEGIGIFPRVVLIEKEWVELVQTAIDFYRNNASVFDVDRVAIYRQQLGTLAIDENPFLSTAALRTLLSVGKTDRQLLKDILSAKVNPMRKAVAAYMIMRFGDGETVDFVSTEIVEYLSSAGSFHDARGLLLSVFAAKDAELGHSREAAREATATVEAKVWDPALTVEERLYFEDVLRLAKPPPIDD